MAIMEISAGAENNVFANVIEADMSPASGSTGTQGEVNNVLGKGKKKIKAGGPGSGRHAQADAMIKHFKDRDYKQTSSVGDTKNFKGGAGLTHYGSVNTKTGAWTHTIPGIIINKGKGLASLAKSVLSTEEARRTFGKRYGSDKDTGGFGI